MFEGLGLALGLLSVPWLLRHLGATGYGVYLSTLSLCGVLGLIELGAVGATLTAVAREAASSDRVAAARAAAAVYRRALLAALASTIALAGLVTVLGPWLFVLTGVSTTSSDPTSLLMAVVVVAGLGFLLPLSLSLHNGLQDLARAAVISGVVRLGSVVGACWAAWRWGEVVAVLWAGAGISALGVGAGLVDAHRRHRAFQHAHQGLTPQATFSQWRGGWSFFVLGLANTSSASAPTLALSSTLGPSEVPTFAVPWRLASMGLGLVVNFSAVLVPGLSEAWARGDRAWVQALVDRLLRAFAVVGGVGVALLAVCGPGFVGWWTGGRVLVSSVTCLSAGVAAATWALLALMRYVLASVGARRSVSAQELVAGVAAFVLALAAALTWGPPGVGGALALGLGGTGGRWLARALRQTLGVPRLAPAGRTWGAALLACATAALVAEACLFAAGPLGPELALLPASCAGLASGAWIGVRLARLR